MNLEETMLEELRQNFVEQYSAIPTPDILWGWITENFEPKSRPLQVGVMQKIAGLDMDIDNVDNIPLLTKKLRINNDVPNDEIWITYTNGKMGKFKIK